jgi:GT2 family glycosyltransferase
MIKYSLLYPYYQREHVLDWTLKSLKKFYASRQDLEIIFVVDLKNTTQERDLLIERLDHYWDALCLRVISNDLLTYNGARAYNLAARQAEGEYLILSNPECRHLNDILGGLDATFADTPDVYTVCACQSHDDNGMFLEWYQHSVHRPANFHFLSALSRQQYHAIGGFDEEYSYGIAYEDNDWLARVRRARVPIIVRDDLCVAHQAHSRWYQDQRLVAKNAALFARKWPDGYSID